MFFLVELKRDLTLHPNTFGPELSSAISHMLYSEIPGTFSGQSGYIVAITKVNEDKARVGRIVEDTGFAVFTVKFKAVVFRPFKNEILEAIVVTIQNEMGIFAAVGPIKVFISKTSIPNDYTYDSQSESYTTVDGLRIAKDTVLRVKITGGSVSDGISCIASIKDDYLGVVEM